MTSKGEGKPQGQVISEALDREGKVYRKSGEFRARRVDVPTAVETILPDGRKETRNAALPGDYIVTGTGGEQYVVKPDVFSARYEPKPGAAGVYLARGYVVAVPNPLGRPVYILAPWGEVQNGAADCMIVDIFDPAAKRRSEKPYIVARPQFDATYKRASHTPWYRR